MSIESIELWHKRARPVVNSQTFATQLGCHFEEIDEMLDSLEFGHTWSTLRQDIKELATRLKKGKETVQIVNRKEFLDSIGDQVVTGIGAAHNARMKATEAIAEISRSNWSKFDENGQPLFDDNGKIKKGEKYSPPLLDGMY